MQDFINVLKEIKRQLMIGPNWVIKRLKPRHRRMLKRAVVGLVLAVVAVDAIALVGIYILGWQNRFSRDIANLLPPLPAIRVDGHWISYGDYALAEHALEVYNQQSASTDHTTLIKTKALETQVVGQLVNQTIIQNWASQHDVTIQSADLQTEVKSFYQQQGGQAATAKLLKQQYGENLNDYQITVRNNLLAVAVEQTMVNDSNLRQTAQATAAGWLQQAKSGQDFTKLVQLNSRDVSALNVNPGEVSTQAQTLPGPVATALISVTDGGFVQKPILIGNTYYVAKRISDSSGNLVAQVLVVPVLDFNRWLGQQVATARVIKLLPQLR